MSQGFGLSATARLALLQRLSKRREEKGPAAGAARAFRELPGQRDMEMIREAAGALGLENPFFRPHEGIAGATTRSIRVSKTISGANSRRTSSWAIA